MLGPLNSIGCDLNIQYHPGLFLVLDCHWVPFFLGPYSEMTLWAFRKVPHSDLTSAARERSEPLKVWPDIL